MNVLDALERGRARAEALMLDACEVTRPGDEEITDPVTGEVSFSGVQVYPKPGKRGRCKIQTGEVQESTPDTAGRRVTVQRYQLHIPIGAGPVQVGDLVKVIEATQDAHLVGRSYRIIATHNKSLATAQRTEIEEVTR